MEKSFRRFTSTYFLFLFSNKDAPDKIKRSSGDFGTKAHDLIEKILAGKLEDQTQERKKTSYDIVEACKFLEF